MNEWGWVIDRDQPYESDYPKRKGLFHPDSLTADDVAEIKRNGQKFRVTDEDGNALYYGHLLGELTHEVYSDIEDALSIQYFGPYNTSLTIEFPRADGKRGWVFPEVQK